MIPQITAGQTINQVTIVPYPSRTRKLLERDISGYIDNVEAIKQTIMHILSTERYAYSIYDDNYGVELQQFIGASIGYVKANIGRVIKEALLQDDRIVDIIIDSIEVQKLSSVLIQFTAVTNLGTFGEVLTVAI